MSFSLLTGGVSGTNSAGTTSSGIDTTTAKLIVINTAWYSGIGNPVLSDNKSNTWNPLTQRSTITPTSSKPYYCINPIVGSGHTFTLAGVSTFPSLAYLIFTGDGIYESENGSSVTNSTIQPGSLTPSVDNSLLITGAQQEETDTFVGVDGGFTAYTLDISGGNYEAVGIAYLIQTSKAAANPTWTFSGGTRCTANIACFTPPVSAKRDLFQGKLGGKLRGKVL